jgi:hypothetical protein
MGLLVVEEGPVSRYWVVWIADLGWKEVVLSRMLGLLFLLQEAAWRDDGSSNAVPIGTGRSGECEAAYVFHYKRLCKGLFFLVCILPCRKAKLRIIMMLYA